MRADAACSELRFMTAPSVLPAAEILSYVYGGKGPFSPAKLPSEPIHPTRAQILSMGVDELPRVLQYERPGVLVASPSKVLCVFPFLSQLRAKLGVVSPPLTYPVGEF